MSVMEIEGGAGIVILLFSQRKKDILANAGKYNSRTMAASAGTPETWQATSAARIYLVVVPSCE
jgi:hypothetical protein